MQEWEISQACDQKLLSIKLGEKGSKYEGHESGLDFDILMDGVGFSVVGVWFSVVGVGFGVVGVGFSLLLQLRFVLV